jgi:predicted nucleic acid-binding Zn finger protein
VVAGGEKCDFPVFLMGVLGEAVFSAWCFCGEFVVNCVAKAGGMCGFAQGLKVGQDVHQYFSTDLCGVDLRERATENPDEHRSCQGQPFDGLTATSSGGYGRFSV